MYGLHMFSWSPSTTQWTGPEPTFARLPKRGRTQAVSAAPDQRSPWRMMAPRTHVHALPSPYLSAAGQASGEAACEGGWDTCVAVPQSHAQLPME